MQDLSDDSHIGIILPDHLSMRLDHIDKRKPPTPAASLPSDKAIDMAMPSVSINPTHELH